MFVYESKRPVGCGKRECQGPTCVDGTEAESAEVDVTNAYAQ